MNNLINSVYSVFQSDLSLTELLLFSQVLFFSLMAVFVGFNMTHAQRWQKAEITEQQKDSQKLERD